MTHVDDGTILALRDNATGNGPDEAHVRDCAICLAALHEARASFAAIGQALSALDERVDVANAKSLVRRRLDAERGDPGARGSFVRWHIGRAAAVLLLTAGAASALPWSPVRVWWHGTASGPASAPEPVGEARESEAVRGGSIAVAVPEGQIVVIVRGADPGSALDVAWVAGTSARISAPPGSSFTYADGRAEVDAAPGSILVEIPRGARLATLRVDGAVYLRRSTDGLEVSGPAVERSEDRIRFVIPGR